MEGCCGDRLGPRRQGSHKTGERKGEDPNSYSSGAYKEEATHSREVNKAELTVLADGLKRRDRKWKGFWRVCVLLCKSGQMVTALEEAPMSERNFLPLMFIESQVCRKDMRFFL